MKDMEFLNVFSVSCKEGNCRSKCHDFEIGVFTAADFLLFLRAFLINEINKGIYYLYPVKGFINGASAFMVTENSIQTAFMNISSGSLSAQTAME